MPCPTCGSELAATADPAALAADNARLARELADAREQQAAMGEILRVISSSPADVSPVFSVIARNAVRLCNARFGAVYSYDGTLLHFVAGHGLTHEARQLLQHQYPIPPRGLNLQAITERGVVHAVDVLEDRRAANLELARTLGYRSNLVVPMLRADRVLGTINVFGVEPKPFSESQIALLQIFAVQAVIAIENVRLFEAEQGRTRELTEALENQTATGEILRVIATSPTAIQPVLEAVVKSAARLCQAYDAAILLREGDSVALGAHDGPIPIDFAKYPLSRRWTAGRAIVDRKTIHIRDLAAEVDEYPEGSALAVRLGHRSIVSTPLMREGEAIGVLVLRRTEVLPFSDKQIALLQTFADQAVIAINNVRLFQELQARTRELTEALEHQSATSEVLGVISRSPNELQPVLDAIVQTAATLCTAESAFITRFSDNQFVLAAANRVDAEHIRYIAQHPISIGRGSITGRVAVDRRVVHVADVLADPEFDHHEWQTVGRQRTVLGVPLLLERSLIGVMILYRTEVAPFTDKQVELVETFADQAVIAIENARLFEEVQARTREVTDALEQQTATSKILSAISGSPGQLDPVFDMLLASARELCEAEFGHLLLFNGETWSPAALHNLPQAYADFWNSAPVMAPSDSLLYRILDTRQWYQIVDAHQGPAYKARQPLAIATVELGGARTLFGVPLLKEGRVIGAIVLYRKEVRPFQPNQIALLSSFADQAVIAIENARLFSTLETRTRELQEALEYQTATSAVLGVIARSPNELQPVLDAIVETASRLCGADYAMVFKLDHGELGLVAAHGAPPDFVDFLKCNPPAVSPDTLTGRTVLERRTIYIEDTRTDPRYRWHEASERGNYRSTLGVPLLRKGEAIGVIGLVHKTVRAFSTREVDLVTTFADQAVIAIENARLFEAEQARTKELQEALEYQTATSEVLNVISRSPSELQPVLDAIVGTALNLCQAQYALISKRGADGRFHLAASANADTEFLEWLRTHPITAGDGSAVGIVAVEKQTIHLHDALADPRFTDLERQRHSKARTMLAVPLMRADEVSGVIFLARNEVCPFTTRQVDLVTTFADQAVIAIENTRLFEAEQERSKELQEALEYQTATSEVLGVISRSPSQVQPVLDTIVAIGARLCEAEFSILFNVVGNECRVAASNNVNSEYTRWLADHPVPLGSGSTSGRAALERRTIHVPDVLEEPAGKDRLESRRRGGQRTCLSVPLLREGAPLGVITLMRSEVRSFTERQVALVETFADQAVIAIENARLFEEVQARTRELTEALEQQTATSEVLSVISSSPGDLEPVFQAMLQNATRICEANFALLLRAEGDAFRTVALHGVPPVFAEERRRNPLLPPNPETALGRMTAMKHAAQIADIEAEPAYRSDPTRWALLSLGGARTVVAVPMLKEDKLLGAIVIYRQEVRPFTDKQIALVTSFAKQAVIAIENARLLDELQARTRELARSVEELRALGEVGQTINSTLDMSRVLQTVLENACTMAQANSGTIYVFDKASGEFHLEAGHNMSDEHIARVRAHPIRLGDPVVGEFGQRRESIQIDDLGATTPTTPLIDLLVRAGVRAVLAVPLLHQGEVVGALVVRRPHAGGFTADTVSLLEAFAAQSAIAIHNARLFHEIEAKGREIEIASRHKSQFVANMSHELRTPLAAMLGYAELLQENIYGALPAKATPILGRIQSNGKHLLGLINTVLDISKIESGQFKLNPSEYALSSMVETVRVATESLAAAKKLTFKTEVEQSLPRGFGDEQRLTQVLLNLVGNAIKFTDRGEVRIQASIVDGRFNITVSDTGPGIPPEERDKVFEKFHQIDNSNTKAKGGTGLGLAIAKEIVEMHGGRIWVESTLGHGATFHLELPVRAAAVGGPP